MRFVFEFEPRFKPVSFRAVLAVLFITTWAGAGTSIACAATAAKAPASPTRSTTHRAKAAAIRTSPPSVRHTLPFLSDDYSRALAEAKARKVPIFVESWAPW
jgi:hypothetical protein